MARKKVRDEIDIRDRRIPAGSDGTGAGRICLRAGATSAADYAIRTAAAHTLIERGEWGILNRLRDRRDTLDIGEVARVLADDDRSLTDLRPAASSQVTLGEASDRLLVLVAATKGKRTAAIYKKWLSKMEAEWGRNRELRSISSDDLREWIYRPRVPGENGTLEPYAANTQAMGAMVGGRLWRNEIAREAEAAEREERRPRLTVNPWKSVQLRQVKKTRHYFLRPEQWTALRDATRGTPSCALLAFGCLAGLRQQEVAHLRVNIDVDLEARLIHVQERKGEHEWETKTARSVRDVPMSNELVELATEHVAAGFASGRYFFHPVGNDKPLHSTTILLWTKKAFKAAGIRYGQKQDALTFHNLRHTFASWLVQGVKVQGPDGKPLVLAVDVLRVAKLLGDSVDQVIETYGHLMPENLADAVAMIDRKIGRDEVAAAPADEVAAMRAEIAQLRAELQAAKAA